MKEKIYEIDNMRAEVTIEDPISMKIKSISDSITHKEVPGINTSRNYVIIKLTATDNILSSGKNKTFTGKSVKPVTETIFESSAPELYEYLNDEITRAAVDLDEGNQCILLQKVTAIIPKYYVERTDPKTGIKETAKDSNNDPLVLSEVTFYKCESESTQTRLRRKMRNLKFIVETTKDVGNLDDEKLKAEAKAETEAKEKS
jgi:hypothetical protein